MKLSLCRTIFPQLQTYPSVLEISIWQTPHLHGHDFVDILIEEILETLKLHSRISYRKLAFIRLICRYRTEITFLPPSSFF